MSPSRLFSKRSGFASAYHFSFLLLFDCVAGVVAEITAEVKPGKTVVSLCKLGDEKMKKETGSVFNKKKNPKTGEKIEKGIAFPTCVSPNACVAHNTPKSSESSMTLSEGDLVKIDLGVHIDGYIASCAHTVVAVSDEEGGDSYKLEGRAADVVECAEKGLEAALRLFRAGRKTSEVPATLERVANDFDCSVVEGVMSHQMKKFVMDANKVVLNKQTPEMHTAESEFEEYEVYAIDVVMSTGSGKTKVLDEKETGVYKRALDKNETLKLGSSRSVLSEIQRKFPALPFPARALEHMRGMNMGILDCVRHEMLVEYPVLYERENAYVAHAKATVLLTPSGVDRITTSNPSTVLRKPEHSLKDSETQSLLDEPLKHKKGKKNQQS